MSERPDPPKPPNSFRITLVLNEPRHRIDQILMEEIRKQERNLDLKNISRTNFKDLFKDKKIRIKGQPAKPSSSVTRGITHVDIMGFKDPSEG